MKHLVLYEGSGNAVVISPIPTNVDLYTGDKLILDSKPDLPAGHKYVVENGVLTTAAFTPSELSAETSSALNKSISAVNYTTEESISLGFTFGGESFSLEPLLREHWTRQYMLFKVGAFQNISIPTLNQTSFQLNGSNIESFWAAFSAAINAIIESDRSAKKAVIDGQ